MTYLIKSLLFLSPDRRRLNRKDRSEVSLLLALLFIEMNCLTVHPSGGLMAPITMSESTPRSLRCNFTMSESASRNMRCKPATVLCEVKTPLPESVSWSLRYRNAESPCSRA